MALLAGTRLGRYEIVALLGAGGMGEVYRARDNRLERDVAIKVLPPDFADDLERVERFEREARAAGRLNHPNITTVHDVGTHEGTTYLVSELLDGETLGAALERGPLSPRKAVDLCLQIARGLAAAHEEGIVHRDLKPANLFILRRGRVKILDFGLAKVRRAGTDDAGAPADTATATAPGLVMGTAAYMAPEQVRGLPVDPRCDLFALGALLYEMLAGKRAFTGASAVETMNAILTEDPDSLAERVSGLPAALEALVYRCLEKNPEERFQSARDLGHALEALSALPGSGPGAVVQAKAENADRPTPVASAAPTALRGHVPRGLRAGGLVVLALVALMVIGALVWRQVQGGSGSSPERPAAAVAEAPRFLAVLPFANTGPDAENDYFADGVTDDILTHLAQVPDFSVVSRTTTMGYKGSDKSVQEIAEELGVDYVLEGSVRRLEDRVRISTQLVDARTDQHLWADAYNRQLEDIFAVQAEIAQSIAAALEARLSASVAERIERPPTDDLEAYDLFLLGRESYYRYELEGTERAMDLFGRALERDPEFALARAWLALAQLRYRDSDGMEASWADSAVVEARQAVAQQPDLAAAYTALGTALTHTGRYGEAMPILERALELNPNDSRAADFLAIAHSHLGSWDEAIRVTRQALELEDARLNLSLHGNLAWYSLHLGLLDGAQAALEPALTFWPDNQETIDRQGWIDLLRGERDAALQAAERLTGLAAEVPRAGLHAAQLFVFLGEIESARDVAKVAYAQSPTAIFDWFSVDVLYGYTLERTGHHERAHAVLAEAERHAHTRIEAGSERRTFRYSLARIHALRGETDEAFRWLDESIDFGWNVAAITAMDPLLESLRDDPRFQSALDRMEDSLAPMRARVERQEP